MNGASNVDRLVTAGVLDDSDLTNEGRDAINGIDLSDDEIDNLKSIQKKLGLNKLYLTGPSGGVGVWRL